MNSTATGNKTATVKMSATQANDGYQYRCKISDGTTTVYSDVATFTYKVELKITSQPSDVTQSGGTGTFTVKATGENLTYQWQYRKTPSSSWVNSTASGNKTATVKMSATQANDGYQYRCKISDGTTTVYSDIATFNYE